MWGRTDSCRRLGPWLSHGCAQLGGFHCLWDEGDPSQEFQKQGRQPLPPSVHLVLLGFTPTSTPKDRVLTQCGSPLGAHPHPTAARGAGPSLRRAPPLPPPPPRRLRQGLGGTAACCPLVAAAGTVALGRGGPGTPHPEARAVSSGAGPGAPGETARLALPSWPRHSPHGVAQVLVVVVKQLEGVDLRAVGMAVESSRCVRAGAGAHAAHPCPGPALPPAVLIPHPSLALYCRAPRGAASRGPFPNCQRHHSSAGTVPSPSRTLSGSGASDGWGPPLWPPGQTVPTRLYMRGWGGRLTSVSGLRFLMMGFSRTDRWCW